MSEGSKLIMPEGFDKSKAVTITGTISTDDSAFAEGKASVNAFLDRGTLVQGSKAPVVTPYPADIKKTADGKYSFSVSVTLSDKPDYQYTYRPDTEADNMKRGNHVLSIVAAGLPYNQNTWNYNIICKED